MNQNTIQVIVDFLTSIGLKVEFRRIHDESFLPGLHLEQGTLVIDPEKLLYPGDILHEAGHLATMPPSVRDTMTDPLENNDMNAGGEMMAISWSYAAACTWVSIRGLFSILMVTKAAANTCSNLLPRDITLHCR